MAVRQNIVKLQCFQKNQQNISNTSSCS